MKISLYPLMGMLILCLICHTACADVLAVPGDIDGDKIVTDKEVETAQKNFQEGKITSEELEEIKYINENYPRTITDDVERSVTLYQPAKKIIVLSADCAEVIRGIGAADQIKAVDSYTAKDVIFFPEFADLPTVGSSFHPDCEAIMEIKPDLVFAYNSVKEEELDDKVEALEIPVARFSACKVSTRDEQLRTLGFLLEKEDEAEELIEFYHGFNDSVTEALNEISEDDKPRVYIECYKDYRARNVLSGTHPMCEIAGGINIAQDVETFGDGTTVELDPEWIIEQNPDIILKVVSGSKVSCGYGEDDSSEMKAVREEIMSRPGFENIDAVKNDRIYLISSHICDRSCNAIGIAYLATWFYPQLLQDIDPQAIHQEYIDEFQGIDFDLKERGVFVYPTPYGL